MKAKLFYWPFDRSFWLQRRHGGKRQGHGHPISGFIYQDGCLTTQYKADIEPVWRPARCGNRSERIGYSKKRKISTGSIKTVISDEKVIIRVEYVDRDLASSPSLPA